MTISLCYLVKDEAEELRRSLASTRGQADEIVVVSTGGDDRCAAIAREFGARLCDYAWRDDFAAARNFALDHARGDWVIFLDADEYLSDDTRANARALIARADATAAKLLLVCLRNVDTDTGRDVVDVYLPRIFRRSPSLRYAGRIHEVLRDNGADVAPAVCVGADELLIIHTGYSSHRYREKCARNVRMLEAELPAMPHPEDAWHMLAEAYEGVGNFAQAVRYAKMDVARGRQPRTYASNSYRLLLRVLSQDPHRWRERADVARGAATAFPELPEFLAEYAECLAYGLDFPGAIRYADLADAVARQPHCGTEPVVFDAAMQQTLAERRRLWQRIVARMATVRVTAGLIVRDGARDLPRWLDSARRAADDLLVLDTGSTDGTVALAEAAGATVLRGDWRDDFAAARNLVLERAAGDWLLTLDADEWFATPELVRPYLAMMDLTAPDVDAVMLTVVNLDEDYGNQELHRFLIPRLLRRRPGLRYEGRVHERLVSGNGPLALAREPYRLHVRHVGYSTSRITAKHRRNLAITLAELAQRGDDGTLHGHLAKTYFGLGDFGQSLQHALAALRSPWHAVGASNEMYDLVLRDLRALRRPTAERLAWAREAVAKYPLLPDYHAALGLLLLEGDGDRGEAKRELLRALRLHQHPEDTSGESTVFTTMLGKVRCALARLHHHEGEDEMARDELLAALRDDPYDEPSLNLLLALTPPAQSLDALTESLLPLYDQREAALTYLSRFAEENGWLLLYDDCARKLSAEFGKSLPRTPLYDLLREGRLAELQAAVVARLRANVTALIVALLTLERGDRPSERGLRKRCESLLPPTLRDLWRAYCGDHDAHVAADAYKAVWSFMLTYGDDEQSSRMGALALRLGGGELRATIDDCLSHDRWQTALSILGNVPAEHALASTADFWRWAGVCLYQLRQPESAAESFAKARALGDQSEELLMYERWLAGDGKGER